MLKKHFQICLSLYTSRVLRSYAVAQEEELKVDDRFSSSLPSAPPLREVDVVLPAPK
jgi:hypothetical protein